MICLFGWPVSFFVPKKPVCSLFHLRTLCACVASFLSLSSVQFLIKSCCWACEVLTDFQLTDGNLLAQAQFHFQSKNIEVYCPRTGGPLSMSVSHLWPGRGTQIFLFICSQKLWGMVTGPTSFYFCLPLSGLLQTDNGHYKFIRQTPWLRCGERVEGSACIMYPKYL